MTDLTGQSIGRYQILARLGEGGMATVYKARDTRLDRDVALKLIRVDQFAPAMMGHILARFEREAKSLARLSHHSIVRVYDYGEHDGVPYLVLEFCGGGDLKQRLTGQPMDWREAIQLVLPVARALRYSHQQGVIHRDIKPSNIMFNVSGEPMLSDFGIAKMLETDNAETLTGTGVGIGTPGYMAPEQWTGETSAQSDQYGLGVVLYELFTGRKPYEADTPAGVLIKQTSEPLPLPSKFTPALPLDVEVALLKSLNRIPVERYADMAEFIKAFEGLLQQSPATESKPPAADPYKTLEVVVTEEKRPPVTPADWGTTANPLPKKKPINWKPIIIGAAAFAVLAGVIWGGRQLSKGGLFAPKPSATPTRIEEKANQPTKKPTNAPIATQAATQTSEPTALPALAIGETRISSKDGMVMVNVGDFLIDQTAITNAMFESFVQDTGYETEIEKANSGYVHSTELVCPTWTVCKPGVIGQDTRYPVTTWKKAKVSWRSSNSNGQDSVVQISQADADNYCKWAGRRLLTEQEFIKSNGLVKGSGLYEWVKEKKIVFTGEFLQTVAYGEYPEITSPDYSLDMLTFRCASSAPATSEASTSQPTPTLVANTLPEEITDDKGVTMRLIPTGPFTMGSNADDAQAICKKYRNDCSRDWFTDEEPPHMVTLDDYYIDVYEVTNAYYKACVEAGACTSPSDSSSYTRANYYGNSQYANYPVIYVDWNQAKAYCEWRGARLPTEAEWEKAARGTDGRTYPWGEEIDCSKANIGACNINTKAVGSYESGKSPYGMYDMAGNVWEWVNDWYGETYYQNSLPKDPQGPASGESRIKRGGSWHYYSYSARSASRSGDNPEHSDNVIGFRCASSPETSSAASTSEPTPTPVTTGLSLSDNPTPLPFQGLAGTWQGSCYDGKESFSIEWQNDGYVVSSCQIDTGDGSTFPISKQSWEINTLSWTCPQEVHYNDQHRVQYYIFKVQSITADVLNLSLIVTVDYPSYDTKFASTCSFQRSKP